MVRYAVLLVQMICPLNGQKTVIKCTNAIHTVMQDEMMLVAYKRNTQSGHCNINRARIAANEFTFLVIANANSKFKIQFFLREPNKTTMIMRLFTRIPAVKISTVKVVESGSAHPVLLKYYFKTLVPSNNMKEQFETFYHLLKCLYSKKITSH